MIRYRVMTIDDYESVYDLWVHTPGIGLNSTDDSREGIDQYLRRNPTTSFVALEDEKIIGAIMAGHDGRRGFIYHTAVSVSHRKQGIGKCLTAHAMAALEEEGIHKVALDAFKENDMGNAFWENIGFYDRKDLVYRNKAIHELKRIDT